MEGYKTYTNKICINCNKQGHTSKYCNFPITSYGILLYRKIEDNIQFLMICRKDTFNYVEFICGRYDINDIEYISNLLSNMTYKERQSLIDFDFDLLWNILWMRKKKDKYNREFYVSKRKFNILKRNNLEELIKNIETKWIYPEWGFPKGKKNLNETEKKCAIREFEEETNFKEKDYTILELEPIKEIFYGSNGIKYKHIYYIATCNHTKEPFIDVNNMNQISEISDIKWFSLQECLEKIRPYDKEKIKMIEYFYKKIM